jgi:hypothetical protein
VQLEKAKKIPRTLPHHFCLAPALKISSGLSSPVEQIARRDDHAGQNLIVQLVGPQSGHPLGKLLLTFHQRRGGAPSTCAGTYLPIMGMSVTV